MVHVEWRAEGGPPASTGSGADVAGVVYAVSSNGPMALTVMSYVIADNKPTVFPTSSTHHAQRSPRQSSGDLEKPPHAGVSEVGPGAVHHRAGTGDHADVVLMAVLDGLWRDARRSLPN